MVLCVQILCDDLVSLFIKNNPAKQSGWKALHPRVLIEVMITKQMLNLDDQEIVAQITENIYLQYFLSYSSNIKEVPFDPSLFVGIRKRLGDQLVGKMNDRIHAVSLEKASRKSKIDKKGQDYPPAEQSKNKLAA